MADFVKTGARWFGGGLFRLFSVDCIFLQSQMVGFVKLVWWYIVQITDHNLIWLVL